LKKCTKCNNLFLDEWKIVKLKSESEKQIFLKDNRKEICPHFDSFEANIPKPVDAPKPKPVDAPKPKPVDAPKPKPVDAPKPKPVVPDPLNINRIVGLPANMNAKDYHDFLMGR
jgi:hypothetical protein